VGRGRSGRDDPARTARSQIYLDKNSGIDLKNLSEPEQNHKSWVPQSSLHPADIGPVQLYAVSQFLLTDTKPDSFPMNNPPQNHPRIFPFPSSEFR
jgi:hypothetical protein